MVCLTFKPHVPPRFDGTLILGESTFRGPNPQTRTGWDQSFDEGFPEEFIIKHVRDNKENDTTTFRKLRESFHPILPPEEFWDRKAFTNFVPELLDHGRARPTARQWDAGRQEFELLLNAVCPKRILVVGTILWRQLPPGENEREESCIYKGHGGDILARWIPHPSSWNRKRPAYTTSDARKITALLMKHDW